MCLSECLSEWALQARQNPQKQEEVLPIKSKSLQEHQVLHQMVHLSNPTVKFSNKKKIQSIRLGKSNCRQP